MIVFCFTFRSGQKFPRRAVDAFCGNGSIEKKLKIFKKQKDRKIMEEEERNSKCQKSVQKNNNNDVHNLPRQSMTRTWLPRIWLVLATIADATEGGSGGESEASRGTGQAGRRGDAGNQARWCMSSDITLEASNSAGGRLILATTAQLALVTSNGGRRESRSACVAGGVFQSGHVARSAR